MAALNKDRVQRVYIYDKHDEFIAVSKIISYPKELFKAAGKVAVNIKSNDFSEVSKGDTVKVVFEYTGGSRHQAIVRVDTAKHNSIDIHVSDLTELEERRRSFKITTNEPVTIYKTKGENAEEYDAVIVNINIGGVLLKTDVMFAPGDFYYLNMLEGELELYTKVLRKQIDNNGRFMGYGCQFVDLTDREEEMVTKFIYDCQIAERERRRKLDDEYGD